MFFKEKSPNSRQGGFTLIEIAIGLIIIGIICVPLMQAYRIYRVNQIKEETKGNISSVQTALIKFVYRTGRYPVPADRSLRFDSALAGEEFVAAISACSAANTTVCSATAAWATAPNNIVLIGAVPYGALGLPKQFATDGYKNKLTYAVTKSLTTGSFNDTGGIIRVLDYLGNPREPDFVDKMQFVIISHGQDGKGAFTVFGVRPTLCATVAGRDQQNCNDDATFTDNYNPNMLPSPDRQQSDAAGTEHYDDFFSYIYTLGSGIWQKVPPATSIFSNTGHINIGPGSAYPQAQVDVTGDATTPGDIKADKLIINRLCDYGEVVGCVTPGSTAGLSGHGSLYAPNEFQPGVLADTPNAADAQKFGGGIACGSSASAASDGMKGVANADELCMSFPSTFTVTGCSGSTAAHSTNASGAFNCVPP